MMSVEEFMEIALGLPEVTTTDGHPTLTGFRVRGKGFCYLDEQEEIAMLKAAREEQAALVAENPEVFAPSWSAGRFAWVEINLAKVDREELVELVTEGWRLSAPKRLAEALVKEQ
jgi:hypothetical protein